MTHFIGEEIEVTFEKTPGPPSSFVWREKEYKVTGLVGKSRRLDFKKQWWRRRHRDSYTVKTDTGETFRLYFYRGPGRKYWILNARLDD
ncbi:MAG: DUF6504 family protein [Planctomycetota bacterium]|jgi:hypothetical protein